MGANGTSEIITYDEGPLSFATRFLPLVWEQFWPLICCPLEQLSCLLLLTLASRSYTNVKLLMGNLTAGSTSNVSNIGIGS